MLRLLLQLRRLPLMVKAGKNTNGKGWELPAPRFPLMRRAELPPVASEEYSANRKEEEHGRTYPHDAAVHGD